MIRPASTRRGRPSSTTSVRLAALQLPVKQRWVLGTAHGLILRMCWEGAWHKWRCHVSSSRCILATCLARC